MDGFVKDERDCWTKALDDDITVTVGVHGDTFHIEQLGDNDDPDLVIVWSKEDARELAKALLTFADS